MSKTHNRDSPRLRFTEEETAAPEQQMPEVPAAKAAKGKQIGKQPKSVPKLSFEESNPKRPSKVVHPIERTVRTAGDQLHRQVAQANEDDNVAVTAALKADDARATVLQEGERAYHARKLRSQRRKAEGRKNSPPAGTNASSAAPGKAPSGRSNDSPHFSSNPASRWQQKRAIRREYAAAKAGKSASSRTRQAAKAAEKTAERAGSATGKLGEYLARYPKALILIALVGILLAVMSSLQSCTPLAQSILESLVIGTYPATEDDVRAAERAYAGMERELKNELDHYEQYHPGYDEYIVEADEIWHDPYVLIAIISACTDGQDWTVDTAYPVLEKYFRLQYVVTESITTEIRYRTERKTGTRIVTDPETGQRRTETYSYDEQVPYTYRICHVSMENRNLSHLPVLSMSHHTMGMYALYMATHGNMEGIFSGNPYATPLRDPMLYDIPQETLDADPTFARLMEEATRYIGYPYVWGGASPETSFDCSGFVSYVFTNSGVYNTGRLGAKGLRSLCRMVPDDQARPGDIVFFEGTMGEGVAGVTHCGIYVGNGMMLHCGSPIGYANLNDAYWRSHFHSFGRIPE
ncbi:MAG: C40 family peptidase [Aristaeellaceae bacterium]